MRPRLCDLVDRYEDYLAALADGTAKTKGIRVGERVAGAVFALRMNDGREANPQFVQPPPGPESTSPIPRGRCWDFGCRPSGQIFSPLLWSAAVVPTACRRTAHAGKPPSACAPFRLRVD
jgi:hypothetical protein